MVPRPPTRPCGTTAALQRHYRRNEQPDAACLATGAAQQARIRAARKALAAEYPAEMARLYAAGSGRRRTLDALTGLARRHPGQYRQILAEMKENARA